MENGAQDLPVDILYIVFESYAELDRPAVPQSLETLLLVCRTWHDVASHHTRLWSTFHLDFQTKEDAVYWAPCVSRRLVLYTANALLDIKLTMPPTAKHISSDTEALKLLESMLIAFVGKAGVTAKRWRTFDVDETSASALSCIMAGCLSFPTPNLQELRIDWLRCRHMLLPNTSALKTLSLSKCTLAGLPNLASVTNLQLNYFYVNTMRESVEDQALASALNVKMMKIETWKPFNLAAKYPNLRSLELCDSVHAGSLAGFCAPMLCDLTLLVKAGRDYLSVVSCTGIQLKNVKKVRIGLHGQTSTNFPDYLEGLRQFLKEVVNLETLIIEQPEVASLVLKLLTDDCEHLFQSHPVRLVLKGHSTELGRGEERLPSINEFRKQTKCVPDCSWDDLFLQLSFM